jgi:peptidoglycan/LPS O-acetylase OafA/YrhL
MKSSSPGTDVLALIGRYRKAIMGFAALSILFFHEYITLLTPATPFLYDVERYLKRFAFMGVDIFFLLSGMGLTYAIKKSGLGTFYYKRFKRIVIPFLLIGILRAITAHWPFELFIRNVTGFNFWATNMYSLLWFVPAIAAFYLLFPWYYKLMSKTSSKLAFTGAVILIWLLLSMLLADGVRAAGREEFYGFTNRIPVFLIGILLGWMAQNRKLYLKGVSWIFLLLMNAAGFYLAIQTNYNGWSILVPVSNCCIPNLLMAVSLTMLLAKFFDLISRFSPSRILFSFLGFFGMVSLEFYCVQEFLAEQIFPQINTQPPALQNLIIFVAVTVVATALYYFEQGFWKLAELPFTRRKQANQATEPQLKPAKD